MIAFIGLGNPGNEYADTKHNAGFWVVDELVRRWKISYKPGKGQYLYSENIKGDVLLVKTTTGMNVSGIGVQDIIKDWNVSLEDLYICLLYTSPSPRD